MTKTPELFGGVGAPRKALENLGVDIRFIDYVEILPYAVQAYNSVFDNEYKPRDIKVWDMDVDIPVHGSPCQDFSKDGLNNINTGRSILYEHTLEIIEKELLRKPKVVIWKNVLNLTSYRHIEHFDHYCDTVSSLGYTTSYVILKASGYGSAQAKDRLYTVSMSDGEYKLSESRTLEKDVRHYLDYGTSFEKNVLSENEETLFFWEEGKLCAKEATKLGYKVVEEFDTVNVEFPNSKTRRGRVGKKVCPTLTTHPRIAVHYHGKLRMLTASEHWRLMGFDDADYWRVAENGLTDIQISVLVGSSICVSATEAIFKDLPMTRGYLKQLEKEVMLMEKKKRKNKISFKLLQKEMESYGYKYSFKLSIIHMLTAVLPIVGVSVVRKLALPYIVVLIIVILTPMPSIILTQFKHLHHLDRSGMVVEYLNNLLPVPKQTPKILYAMETVLPMLHGDMKECIEKIVEYIRTNIEGTDLYVNAFKITEIEFQNTRIYTLHQLMLTIENQNSVNYLEMIDNVNIDTQAWISRTYEYELELKRKKTRLMLLSVLILLMSMLFVFVYSTSKMLMGFTDMTGYQILIAIFIIGIMFVICMFQIKLNGAWLVGDYNHKGLK